jgi:HK97 gp10 family phage protein
MPPVITVKVEGLDAIQDALERMPRKISLAILRRSTRAGAREFLDEMRARVARSTDWLHDHITMRTRVRSAELSAHAIVGILRQNYPPRGAGKRRSTIRTDSVARYLEFGTRKMPAQPFMAPSFEAKKAQALAVFVDTAGQAFREEAP